MLHLAIETSGAVGQVALGRDDELIEARALTQERRHNAELLPTIDALLRDHGQSPTDLDTVMVSTGPGSFTGVRAGVTAAKTIAHFTGAQLVAVSTLDALAVRINDHASANTAAVVLNVKSDTAWCGIYKKGNAQATIAADVRTLTQLHELCDASSMPVDLLIGDPLPALPQAWQGLMRIAGQAATVRAEDVLQLGRKALQASATADPLTLAPCYGREPEAVTLWDQRHAN